MDATNNNLGTAVPNGFANTGSSPWEDGLDTVEEPKKSNPKIIGTLDNQPAKPDSKPFNVPKDINENVGQKVPASDFIVPKNPNAPQNNTVQSGSSAAVNPAKVSPPSVAVPQQPQAPRASQPASEFDFDDFIFDTSMSASQAQDNQISGTNALANQTIANKPVFASNTSTPNPMNSAVSHETKAEVPRIPLQPSINITQQGIQPLAMPKPVSSDQSKSIQNVIPASNEKIQETSMRSVSGVNGLFSFFRKPIASIGIACLLFLTSLITLTELGVISLGIEGVYGAIGIEKIWGGLPASTERGIIYSASKMRSNPNYKIDGTIKIKIDNSIKSNVISPLSFKNSSRLAIQKDVDISPYQKAFRTLSDDYYYYETDISSEEQESEIAETETSPSVTSAATEEVSADESAPKTGFTELEAAVSLKSSSSALETKFSFQKDNKPAEISLVNSEKSLFVKTSENVKFDNNSNPAVWVKYDLDMEKNIQEGFFNYSTDSGFSIKGKRAGNEKVDGVRCYRYYIESLEIGKALAPIGISSDVIQAATGSIWIGVHDKLIHKAQLKITTPVSSAISLIELDLTFSGYGLVNSINLPTSSETVVASGSPEEKTPDEMRKADVDALLAALKEYKNDYGDYPISDELLKLNESDNIIEKTLVPNYMENLPVDPDSADGWYYAYKSDGSKCSISARLENQDDPDGQLINDTLLYLKYNNQ